MLARDDARWIRSRSRSLDDSRPTSPIGRGLRIIAARKFLEYVRWAHFRVGSLARDDKKKERSSPGERQSNSQKQRNQTTDRLRADGGPHA